MDQVKFFHLSAGKRSFTRLVRHDLSPAELLLIVCIPCRQEQEGGLEKTKRERRQASKKEDKREGGKQEDKQARKKTSW